MPATTIGSFTATGNSTPVNGDQVDMLISGTFNATITLQAEDTGGNWVDVPGGTHTTPGFANAGSAAPRNWRLACTGFTSGEAAYELTAMTDAGRR